MMVVNQTMAKTRDAFGMELVRKNFLKPWAHISIRQELVITLCPKWQVRKSWRPQGEISPTGQCNREPSSHGFREEPLISKVAVPQHQPNTHLARIAITEIKYIQLVNSADSTYPQAWQTFKSRCHTCIKQWMTALRHLNPKTIISKRLAWAMEREVISQTQNNWNRYQDRFMKITRRAPSHTRVECKILRRCMGSTTSSIKWRRRATRVRNNTFMAVRARDQVLIFPQISCICL